MATVDSQPSDAQLLEEYLRPRIDTGESPSPLVHTADVYSLHPEDLTREHAPVTSRDGVTRWYFFSTLRYKASSGQRTRRLVASCGSWHVEHRAKPILAGEGGAKIGYHKTFTFSRKENGKLLRLGWIMSEVGFSDGDGGGQGRPRIVLCKVYRSPRCAAAPAPETSGAAERGASAVAGRPTAADGARGSCDHSSDGVHKRSRSWSRMRRIPCLYHSSDGVYKKSSFCDQERRIPCIDHSSACDQERRIPCIDHSTAWATKAPRKEWLVAQVELGGDASPAGLIMHKVCRIGWIRSSDGLAFCRNRKTEETSGCLVLPPASAVAVQNGDSFSSAGCGEQPL